MIKKYAWLVLALIYSVGIIVSIGNKSWPELLGLVLAIGQLCFVKIRILSRISGFYLLYYEYAV